MKWKVSGSDVTYAPSIRQEPPMQPFANDDPFDTVYTACAHPVVLPRPFPLTQQDGQPSHARLDDSRRVAVSSPRCLLASCFHGKPHHRVNYPVPGPSAPSHGTRFTVPSAPSFRIFKPTPRRAGIRKPARRPKACGLRHARCGAPQE
jgi:hypothetical protein